jgi:hypothetical protein
MVGERRSLIQFKMDHNLGAWQCKWRLVEIEIPVEVRVGRQLWVHSRRSKEIESELDLK